MFKGLLCHASNENAFQTVDMFSAWRLSTAIPAGKASPPSDIDTWTSSKRDAALRSQLAGGRQSIAKAFVPSWTWTHAPALSK